MWVQEMSISENRRFSHPPPARQRKTGLIKKESNGIHRYTLFLIIGLRSLLTSESCEKAINLCVRRVRLSRGVLLRDCV